MNLSALIAFAFSHPDQVAAYVTYVMASLVIGAHLFRGFAFGVRAIARWTSFRWDDALGERLFVVAESIEVGIKSLAKLHARLMPTVADDPPNPTPSLERVEQEDAS